MTTTYTNDFFRHTAYCLESGEILTCTNGHTLKRAIARRRRLDGSHWVVTHDHGKALCAKVLRVQAERGLRQEV